MENRQVFVVKKRDARRCAARRTSSLVFLYGCLAAPPWRHGLESAPFFVRKGSRSCCPPSTDPWARDGESHDSRNSVLSFCQRTVLDKSQPICSPSYSDSGVRLSAGGRCIRMFNMSRFGDYRAKRDVQSLQIRKRKSSRSSVSVWNMSCLQRGQSGGAVSKTMRRLFGNRGEIQSLPELRGNRDKGMAHRLSRMSR